jgi:anthranilate phosphoribosyltransferase
MSNPAGRLADLIVRAAAPAGLSAAEAEDAVGILVGGTATNEQIAELLTVIAKRGPTAGEIAGGARAMRANMVAVPGWEDQAIDVCGTGGDGSGTLNVSTAVALVVAACGVPVAKHGNRAMSSRSGSADVLEALGVGIDLDPIAASRCIYNAGICFMFAQRHHPAVKHVAQVRRELGFRTIFNLLGPISNPARVKRQLVGVYGAEWVEPVANALHELGSASAWVVHGTDGLDELSIAAPTKVAALQDGTIRTFEVTPEDAGLPRSPISAIKGGDARDNAAAIGSLLHGERGPFRDIVLLNAAAALIVAERVSDLKTGVALAAQCIDNGNAVATLEQLVEASHA